MYILTDKNQWEAELNTKWAGQSLYYSEEIVSTNVTAAVLGEEGAGHGTLVAADKQTGGRGRRGRSWESPAGKNLYFSILLRPEFAPEKAAMLTLVMAVSAAKAIEAQETKKGRAVQSVGIKWPNDILINGKKICGILTEMKVEKGIIGHVIVGVGINVKPQNFDGELTDKASSLEQELDTEIDRIGLLRNIMEIFEADYEMFAENGDLKPFVDYYHSRLLNKGKQVMVLDPKDPFEGIAKGITETGELMIEKEDGQIVNVYAGEVSVRGLLGYV